MYPFYAPHPSYHVPQRMSAPSYPTAPHAVAAPVHSSTLRFDEKISRRYAESDARLHEDISRAQFPDPERRRVCLDFVKHLRIYRYLFMHIYLHVLTCCRGRYLHLLEEKANVWKRWGSVQQLTHHAHIRNELASFWENNQCHKHDFLSNERFLTSDDNSDLLCHILYCGRKSELYELQSKEVIELLWQFLSKPQESDVMHRLRAIIYRMARKSAYPPHALQIPPSSITNRRDMGVSGANGLLTKATRDGRESVVIKKIVCGDFDTRRTCLEMFASEAILWATLRHKNIVPFLGVVIEGTFDMGLVAPFYSNGNIRVHMTRYDPRDWPALARRWGGDLAEALAYIHSQQPPIIHGDIKGNNVLVDDGNHARLGDFGQSYASDSRKYLDSTRVGLAANPVHWMAPELILSADNVKATDKSDVYAMGCVLYEMLSGKIPFEGRSQNEVARCAERGVLPERPESISRDDRVWKVAKSCWERSPEGRPSATRLVSLLH